MAKISYSALFSHPLQKYKLFLIFGNEPFLIERAVFCLAKKLRASVERVAEADIANRLSLPPSLFPSLERSSLFYVHEVTEKILPSLSALSEGVFAFSSEKMRASSKLVSFFATSSEALAISAYPCPITLAELDVLSSDLVLSSPFKDGLLKVYRDDRMGLGNALEKMRWMGEDLEEALPFFLDPTPSSDDFIPLRNAFLLKNQDEIRSGFARLPNMELIPFVRTLSKAFLTLLDHYASPKNSTFPVFFKDQPIFESARIRWSQQEILLFFKALLRAEDTIKMSSATHSEVSRGLLEQVTP